MTDRKTLAIEVLALDEAESFWDSLLAGDELTDGEALDAVLAFAAVDGEESTDHECLERIEYVIATWRARSS